MGLWAALLSTGAEERHVHPVHTRARCCRPCQDSSKYTGLMQPAALTHLTRSIGKQWSSLLATAMLRLRCHKLQEANAAAFAFASAKGK